MKTTSLLGKEIEVGRDIADEIHETVATLTRLIHEAREKKIVVCLDNANGFSASNGLPITAKITAKIVFGEDGTTMS